MSFPYLWPFLMWLAAVLAMSTVGAVVAERALYGIRDARRRRFEARWTPTIALAAAGDDHAVAALTRSAATDRIGIATLLITPLIEDRDPRRIARTREIAEAMSLIADADAFLDSMWWWRRALALRALGLMQVRTRTARVVAALDDAEVEVRSAALDALADLRDPASLQAIVVRLLDTTLPRGRRAGALVAFGSEAEPLLIDYAGLDPAHDAKYALAFSLCGTARSAPTLCRWTADARPEVRAGAFDALAHVGLDDSSARLAIAALDDADVTVRAAAARALQGWTGPGDAVPHLARHLDDTWIVAARAARALQSMAPEGVEALRACSARRDLAGLLAQQMLWELLAA
jgi:HEAT repeat protein